ncbi:protein FAM234A-like [Littorina saxatilis]|uniref:protein FAM234A-like n=1 Tax=Littorina saxatilis TaxID=31220 RepID=UPI0038B4C398
MAGSDEDDSDVQDSTELLTSERNKSDVIRTIESPKHIKNGTHLRNVSRSGRSGFCSPTVCAVLLVSSLLSSGLGYMAGIFTPPFTVTEHARPEAGATQSRTERSWRTKIADYGTESCVRLIDVDGDGMDDVIIGLAYGKDITTMIVEETMDKYCQEQGMQTPCAGAVVALRGYDGKLLWQAQTYAEIFEINCNHVDVNKDGTKDCIVSGRLGTINAIDPKTGEVLWEGDPNVVNRGWNIYSYTGLPDFDYDGVPEIVISHGGDPTVPADVVARRSGWLLMLSGATGKQLGTHVAMPEDRETYCAPTMHTRKDGSQYILYGSGGETVGGRFLAMSVPDFYRRVFQNPRDSVVPNVKGDYKQWGFKAPNQKGEITLFVAEKKGVMVPPVMVDMTGDGVKDILMNSFDGNVVLFDGETLEILWKIKLEDRESYSTPAPGYFNDDDVLDFMVHWSWGSWPYYKSTDTIILDGRDGTVLWNMTTAKYDVTSDLVARTHSKHRDVFLFRVQGRRGRDPKERGAIHGATGIQREVRRREVGDQMYELHETQLTKRDDNNKNFTSLQDLTFEEAAFGSKQTFAKDFVECESDQTVFVTELFALDRTTMTQPIKLWERGSEKHYYQLTQRDRQRAQEVTGESGATNTSGDDDVPWARGKRADNPTPDKPFCIIMQPDERTTGALGDVDGDGKLDLIINVVSVGLLRDEHAQFMKMQFDTDIYKETLEDYLGQKLHVPANVTVHERMKFSANENDMTSLKFLPKEEQVWGGYMGTLGDGIYDV